MLNYKLDYKLIRSRRKTISIEVTYAGEVIVKAPYYASTEEIEKFLEEKLSWIGEKRQEAFDRLIGDDGVPVNTEHIDFEEMKSLGERMMKEFVPRIREYASILGVTYGRVTIRNQQTRWGSCSSKGNLNFNCLLMLAPVWVQDYVIVHELCHRIEMNHSKRFWNLVESVMPDYKEGRDWLDNEGKLLMLRAFGPEA